MNRRPITDKSDAMKLGEDVWLEPIGWLGTLEGFERVEGGVVYHVFVVDGEPEDEDEDES